MRLSTLLALIALGALFVWSARVMDRPDPRDPLSNGAAQAVDGDSLRLNGQMMRLQGIDAPEFNQTCQRDGRDVNCGREAAAALRKLLARAPVTCVGDRHDRYQRLLVTCRSMGVDIAAAQVRAGMAVATEDYFVEEAEARNEGRGLWAGTFDQPRDWRAAHPPPLVPPAGAPATPGKPAAVPTPPQRP